VSNNGRKVTADTVAKMKGMGFENPKPDQIYGSSKLLAAYMEMHLPQVKKVYAISSKSVKTELESKGIEVLGAD
jgi:ribonucleotide monophosphatase NagD (HAD superfamily)